MFSLVATSGSLLELYRQLCLAMGVENHSYSSAYLTKTLREMFCDIAAKKQISLLVIDEAHLLRLDVFKQLHTLAQIHYDSQALLPIVLSGQDLLIDKLVYHTSRPFSWRILGRTRLEALNRFLLRQARAYGPSVARLLQTVWAENILEMVRECRELMELAQGYSPERLQVACRRAIYYRKDHNFYIVALILDHQYDRLPR